MASTALDLGLRGVAVGLFFVICIVLLRCAPLRVAARLALAMSVAGAAYAISTAPFFPMGSFGWNSPFVVLSMGFPVVFLAVGARDFRREFRPAPLARRFVGARRRPRPDGLQRLVGVARSCGDLQPAAGAGLDRL